MAPPARAATSAMSASSRTTSPISSRSCARPRPSAPLTLVGHSSGGGFALRVAGSPIQNLFDRTVLLAPYLGYDAPTTPAEFRRLGQRRHSAHPRPAGAAQHRHRLLRGAAGARLCGAAEFREESWTSTYSDRLMRNFASHPDFRTDLAAATRPITHHRGCRRRTDARGQICRGSARPRAAGRRQADRGRQSHGHRQRAAAVSAIADDVATRGTRANHDQERHMIESRPPSARRYRRHRCAAFANRGSTISPA